MRLSAAGGLSIGSVYGSTNPGNNVLIQNSVGIGTTAPGQKLDVAGNINVSSGSAYMYNGANVITASTTLGNFFFGNSGNLTMTGGYNTANGGSALLSNITGNGNTANGFNSLFHNTTGTYNVASGLNSLYSNTTGGANVASGYDALIYNTTGNYNAAYGNESLFNNTTGGFNTANGAGAGFTLLSGSSNTFFGSGTDVAAAASTTLTNSTAIGNGAQVTASNQMVLGNSSVTQTLLNGNVGIGTTSPGYKLTVSDNGADVLRSYNASGYAALGTSLGSFWFQNSIGLSNGAQIFNANASGDITFNGDGSLSIHPADTNHSLNVAGRVVPTASNSYNLGGSGSNWGCLYYNGGTLGTCASDARLKTDIQDLAFTNPVQQIVGLRPRTFAYTNATSTTYDGLVAQEVQQVAPELVVTDASTSYEEVRYGDVQWLIIEAVQDIANIAGTFEQNLIAWLGNAANGIHDLYATIFHGQELCLTNSGGTQTCINQQQLAAVLAVANQSASAPASPPPSTSSATDTPPVIAVNGANPAVIQVGASYSDLGATITGPQADLNLGIKTFVNNQPMTPVLIDTSAAATDTIDYVLTNQNGFTSTSTRTVIIQAANDNQASSTPANDNTAATTTVATSSAQ